MIRYLQRSPDMLVRSAPHLYTATAATLVARLIKDEHDYVLLSPGLFEEEGVPYNFNFMRVSSDLYLILEAATVKSISMQSKVRDAALAKSTHTGLDMKIPECVTVVQTGELMANVIVQALQPKEIYCTIMPSLHGGSMYGIMPPKQQWWDFMYFHSPVSDCGYVFMEEVEVTLITWALQTEKSLVVTGNFNQDRKIICRIAELLDLNMRVIVDEKDAYEEASSCIVSSANAFGEGAFRIHLHGVSMSRHPVLTHLGAILERLRIIRNQYYTPRKDNTIVATPPNTPIKSPLI